MGALLHMVDHLGLTQPRCPVQCRSVFQTTDAKDGDARMLILGRKLGERIRLTLNGIEIWVEVNRIAANDVRIGITAPPAVEIVREEIIGHDAPQ